jgi:pyridoxal phosphate enzyme (YggS family)
MSIESQLQAIKQSLPPGVQLIAVSKTQPAERIKEAYAAGQRKFGESRPQALLEKIPQLPADTEWHFIGHLQTNKVRMVVGAVHTIHSADSQRLLLELNREAARRQITQRCLLQVHIAREASKFGFAPEELPRLLATGFLQEIPHLQVAGLMGMATLTDNSHRVRQEFRTLKNLFTELQQTHFKNQPAFCELSMGMSDDYPIAVEEGSTMVRIGTTIFS